MIKPQDIIQKYSVEELIETANHYFKTLKADSEQLAKPFNNFIEAPNSLKSMGILLDGLQLNKTMSIIDFGCGTGWFSRFMNELQCQTILCDASEEALKWSKYLFENSSFIKKPLFPPQFLLFNGHQIDIQNESIDRIICFDSFHHIPNQEEVLAEFSRVLKQGGIAGFSEPGIYHSQNAISQSEMQKYRVLENDIILKDIFKLAKKHGFTHMNVNIQTNLQLTLKETESFELDDIPVQQKVLQNIKSNITDRNVFFLYKGASKPDSRSHLGLSHQITSDTQFIYTQKKKTVQFSVCVRNTGKAQWLNKNIEDIGVVRIGLQLYDENKELLQLDFARFKLSKSLKPGDQINCELSFSLSKNGIYYVLTDMVSEEVCWFENCGSKPLWIKVLVE